VRVLYLNHTSTVGGGERSLLELLPALGRSIEPLVACPEGDLADAAIELGVPVITVPGIDASFRLHPARLSRGAVAGTRAAVRVRRISRSGRIDLVHANSIRAGLVAVLASRLGAAPAVVHVRDCLPDTAVARVIRRTLRQGAAALVANSDYTARSFAPDSSIRTVYNSVDLERFDPAQLSRKEARARVGLAADESVLAVVAQITPWKAQADAIRIVASLQSAGRRVHLLLVGSAKFVSSGTRYQNRAYEKSLHDLCRQLGVSSAVHFFGERQDVPTILRAADLVLVPSWHEPFGRTIIEAMAMETPVLATSEGGPPEIIRDGVDGLLLPPRSPDIWADAARVLLADPDRRKEMGLRGRESVSRRFTPEACAVAVREIYESVVKNRRPGAAP
jgi:glycosyltransferase involved in cell wall biosynthesis